MTYYQTRLCLGPFPCLAQKSSHNTRMFSGCTDSIPSKLEWVAARQLDGLVIEDISPNIYIYVQKCVQNVFKIFCGLVLSQSKLALLPWLGVDDGESGVIRVYLTRSAYS